jgi:Thoeris protein ThsB, TIR-like domain
MTTYVAFDADKDIWAYRFMRGWSANKRIDFELLDAHDLDNMTDRARGEIYVKSKLRERMNRSTAVVVLVGESTKFLHKYVRWEIDLAIELRLPLIAVNLNQTPTLDLDRCPAILRDTCAVHIPFKLAAIQYALSNWPMKYRSLASGEQTGSWTYPESLTSTWLDQKE